MLDALDLLNLDCSAVVRFTMDTGYSWAGTKRDRHCCAVHGIVYGGMKANQNILFYRILPSAIEWNTFKSLRDIHYRPGDRIQVISPNSIGIERYDEFGTLTSNYLFDVLCMLICVFHEGEKRWPMPLISVVFPNEEGPAYDFMLAYFYRLPDGRRVYHRTGDNVKSYDMPAWVKEGANSDHGVFFIKTPLLSNATQGKLYVLNLREMFSERNYRK